MSLYIAALIALASPSPAPAAAWPPPRAPFTALDANHDGRLSFDEYIHYTSQSIEDSFQEARRILADSKTPSEHARGVVMFSVAADNYKDMVKSLVAHFEGLDRDHNEWLSPDEYNQVPVRLYVAPSPTPTR